MPGPSGADTEADTEVDTGADAVDGFAEAAGAAGAMSAESPADCASGSVPEPWSASAAGSAATGHITRPATPSRAAMVTIALLRIREPSVVTTFAYTEAAVPRHPSPTRMSQAAATIRRSLG